MSRYNSRSVKLLSVSLWVSILSESRDPWTVKERDFVEPENAPSQLAFLLDELLKKYVAHLNPNVKQVIKSEFYSFSNILRAIFPNRLPRSGYWP
jgi:hypothetical protein